MAQIYNLGCNCQPLKLFDLYNKRCHLLQMELSSRIIAAREYAQLTQSGLAKAAGVSQQAIQKLETGQSRSSRKLTEIALACMVRPEWLASGLGPMTSEAKPHDSVSNFSETENGACDHIRVNQLDGDAEMGEGRVNDDYPEVIRSMDFSLAYIRAIVGFIPPPGRLVMVTGRGDSMLPVIQPGESLIVDTGVTSFDGDGIYLINTGNGQQVKGLQDRGEAVYVVSANNVLYPAFPLPLGAVVGGKVYLRNRIDRFS